MPDLPIRRALLSVSDKTGLLELATALAKRGVLLLSTGGTAEILRKAGLVVTDVSTETGFPEIMDGRVKTLHPKIHGGLLAVRDNVAHQKAMTQNAITAIDLLVVNLYPFEETAAARATDDKTIENIDVGGPAMIRAAAKNHASVTTIVDPADYEKLLAEIGSHNGATKLATRKGLAAKAFARTAAYDAAIAGWFNDRLGIVAPDYFATGGKRVQSLRYGENPHQSAALYATADHRPGIASAKQVQGKELSYNNINDADAALEAVSEFTSPDAPACVIVKHANPCGVATAATLDQAYARARDCDPVSTFGGIIAVNRAINAKAAMEMVRIFSEVIIAPAIDSDALDIFATKKNLRVLLMPHWPDPAMPATIVKSVAGGLLVQSRDNASIDAMPLSVVTKRQPTHQEMRDLRFAFRVAKHVKSNAIVFVKDGATVGIGAGQMSRIDSTRIAVQKSLDAAKAKGLAEPLVKGAVLASDAFFPFPDGVEAAAAAGATAIIQPGGAMKDDDVIKAADAAGLAMVFTGHRHFRH
jgi:phosphoribosylaminoimidazolecarboxamide formyltransferase / IMP cyclohydrolase